MCKVRIKFAKTGAACYISHLDLMKTIQRSFCRAKLDIRYSSGFNPHILLSILVPLSTGYQSLCDFCDFELIDEEIPCDILERLNKAFPAGLTALAAYPPISAINKVAYCGFDIEYQGVLCTEPKAIFSQPFLIEKRSKRGSREVDICDYIRDIEFENVNDSVVCHCTLKAGDDPLNPAYITQALVKHGDIPAETVPQYIRTHILDENGKDFL